jgi:hypothetical protein
VFDFDVVTGPVPPRRREQEPGDARAAGPPRRPEAAQPPSADRPGADRPSAGSPPVPQG